MPKYNLNIPLRSSTPLHFYAEVRERRRGALVNQAEDKSSHSIAISLTLIGPVPSQDFFSLWLYCRLT